MRYFLVGLLFILGCAAVVFFADSAHCQGLCIPTICSVDSECPSPGCHCAQPLGSGIGVCS